MASILLEFVKLVLWANYVCVLKLCSYALLEIVQSDCFYNAGWTEDIREAIAHLHHEYPVAPLFAVGTSIGANILVHWL